jgi:hypothetical protein
VVGRGGVTVMTGAFSMLHSMVLRADSQNRRDRGGVSPPGSYRNDPWREAIRFPFGPVRFLGAQKCAPKNAPIGEPSPARARSQAGVDASVGYGSPTAPRPRASAPEVNSGASLLTS